jgi:hypothetical protein
MLYEKEELNSSEMIWRLLRRQYPFKESMEILDPGVNGVILDLLDLLDPLDVLV